MDLATQKKMKFIREQYPKQRIVFIFMNSQNKIRKGSKTTYEMWAKKQGFETIEPRDLARFIKTTKQDILVDEAEPSFQKT